MQIIVVQASWWAVVVEWCIRMMFVKKSVGD